jgi:aerobic C4-dicarboxylate transport protein
MAVEAALSAMPSAHKVAPPVRWYKNLTIQVLIAMLLGALVGWLFPAIGPALRPFAELFIKMVKMVIGPLVFLMVVTGITGMGDLKRVGRVGVKAVLYFEVVTTIALVIGLFAGNIFRPGSGMTPPAANSVQSAVVEKFAGAAKEQSFLNFVLNIVPDNIFGAFERGDVLQIMFFAILFGAALVSLGERGKKLEESIERLSAVLFGVIAIVIRYAPIAAFSAMAFTVGGLGLSSLGSLAILVLSTYAAMAFFIFVVLGLVARIFGFGILRFLSYIREEIVIMLSTSNSESVLPRLMDKLQTLGCARSVVALVLPTGYTLNQDGTSIYLSLSTLFIAQAYGIHLTITQQVELIAIMMITSKGVGGVSGAGFVILASTLAAIGTLPVEGLALLLGVERFMSMGRGLVNMIGNAVATVVVSKSENALDQDAAIAEYRKHFGDPTISSL